jgi:hypothetical protein
MHEVQTIFLFVLTRLIRNAILSGITGFTFGSAIGYGVGAIRRRIEDTVYVSIVGAIAGSLCVCSAPPVSRPGSFESWGSGGGLGSLAVILSVVFLALGSIVGALLASTLGFKAILKLDRKGLGGVAIALFAMMSIALYQGYRDYCFPRINYCS